MPRPQQPTLPVAPKRQTDKTPVTPIIGDLVLSEVEDYSRKKLPEYGSKHPKKLNSDPTQYKFPDHELVLIRPVANERDGIFEFIYAAKRDDQDKYNFEFTQADIGGTKFDAVKRDYLIKRDDFTPQTPAMGTAMTDVPSGRFSASAYVLASRQQIRTNDELDSLYILERRTYVKKVSLVEASFDELSKRTLHTTQTLYYKGETVAAAALAVEAVFADTDNAFWTASIDAPVAPATIGFGVIYEGRQLTDNWFLIVKRQIIAGEHSGGTLTIESGLTTTKNYSWPPVLSEFEIMDWDKRDGSTDFRVRYAMDPAGYSGPSKATVVITWALTIPTGALTKAKQLEGKSVSYSCPYFSVNIPPCLRPTIELVCDIGNEHPIFKQNVGSLRIFPGTTETAWADVLADVDIRVYRGGYLVTKTTISPPTTATS